MKPFIFIFLFILLLVGATLLMQKNRSLPQQQNRTKQQNDSIRKPESKLSEDVIIIYKPNF